MWNSFVDFQGCFKWTAYYTYQNSHEGFLLNLCLVRCSRATGLVCKQWYFSLSLFPHLSPFQHCPEQSVLSTVPLTVSLTRPLGWASRVHGGSVLPVCVFSACGWCSVIWSAPPCPQLSHYMGFWGLRKVLPCGLLVSRRTRGLVLAFIHPEDVHALGMVPGDSCSCGSPRQVHKQLPCGLVSTRMEKVWRL